MSDQEAVDHRAIAEAVARMATDAVLGAGADLTAADGTSILDVLAVLATITEAAHASLGTAVAEARTRDCSWAEIGGALRMSRQAAFQRFGRRGAEDG